MFSLCIISPSPVMIPNTDLYIYQVVCNFITNNTYCVFPDTHTFLYYYSCIISHNVYVTGMSRQSFHSVLFHNSFVKTCEILSFPISPVLNQFSIIHLNFNIIQVKYLKNIILLVLSYSGDFVLMFVNGICCISHFQSLCISSCNVIFNIPLILYVNVLHL